MEGLSAFHGAGLVHRDIKPLNIIFAEATKRFKLIDLGACADLRSGGAPDLQHALIHAFDCCPYCTSMSYSTPWLTPEPPLPDS
jgi:serine/threonine protein kinase